MAEAKLTPRQREIKQRLDKGMQARAIAEDLGITRNAVYQQIQRGRRDGWLPADYTPTGLPMRERTPGYDTLARLLADNNSDADDGAEEHTAGALALVQELRRTRDEVGSIYRRLAAILPN